MDRRKYMQEYKNRQKEDLCKVVKKLLVQKRETSRKMKEAHETLRDLREEMWILSGKLDAAKTTLGQVNANNCPALQTTRKYNVKIYTCRAKNFKHPCWTKENMFRLHCYACKLTQEQKKLLMQYQVILHGKKNYDSD